MATKKSTIIVKEGDKFYDLFHNYLIAEEKSFKTPQYVIEEEVNEIIEKIKVLTAASSLIENGTVRKIIEEKIAAYKDCSQSIIKISQIVTEFSNKMEIENGTK